MKDQLDAVDLELKDRYKAVVNIGLSTLKALLIMNGGASVAFLTLIGKAIEHKDAFNEAAVTTFTSAMQWFIYGTFFGVLAYGFIFGTTCLSYERERKISKNRQTHIGENMVRFVYCVTLVFGCFSLGSFLWASWQAVDGFREVGMQLFSWGFCSNDLSASQ